MRNEEFNCLVMTIGMEGKYIVFSSSHENSMIIGTDHSYHWEEYVAFSVSAYVKVIK